jgi:maltose-binding protein MalE
MKFDYACLRKVSAILLAVVLLFGLAACKTKAPATADPTPDASPTDTPVTTEEPTPEPTPTEPPPDLGGRTIKVGAWWKVFPPAENYEYYAECMELLESVQEKYNCVLESVVYQGGLDAFAAAIKTQISSGSLEYDAFLLHGWWFMPNGAIAGAVAPLDDYLDFSDPRMDHALAEANVYQGKHYAYALYAPGFQGCIFFNKKLLADNGVEAQELYDLVDSGQWTFDKLREYALLCTKDTGDPATSIYGVGFYGWFYCANSFIYANNSSIVTGQAPNLKFNLDDPNALEALQFLWNLVNVDKVVSPTTTSWQNDTVLFKHGRLAFYTSYYWDAPQVRELADDLGILPMAKGKAEYDLINTGPTEVAMYFNAKSENLGGVVAAISEYMRGTGEYAWPEFHRANDELLVALNFDENNFNSVRMTCTGNINYWPLISEEFRTSVIESGYGLYQNEEPRAWVEANKARAEQLIMDAFKKE